MFKHTRAVTIKLIKTKLNFIVPKLYTTLYADEAIKTQLKKVIIIRMVINKFQLLTRL